jgi:hypothetical protein
VSAFRNLSRHKQAFRNESGDQSDRQVAKHRWFFDSSSSGQGYDFGGRDPILRSTCKQILGKSSLCYFDGNLLDRAVRVLNVNPATTI